MKNFFVVLITVGIFAPPESFAWRTRFRPFSNQSYHSGYSYGYRAGNYYSPPSRPRFEPTPTPAIPTLDGKNFSQYEVLDTYYWRPVEVLPPNPQEICKRLAPCFSSETGRYTSPAYVEFSEVTYIRGRNGFPESYAAPLGKGSHAVAACLDVTRFSRGSPFPATPFPADQVNEEAKKYEYLAQTTDARVVGRARIENPIPVIEVKAIVCRDGHPLLRTNQR